MNLIIEDLLRFFTGSKGFTVLSLLGRDTSDSIQLGVIVVDRMIVLDKLVDLDDTMLISLDLFIDVVSLELGQDLDNSLLESGPDHQRLVVRGCESLLSDPNSMDWLHSISDLVVLSCHELAAWSRVLIDHIFKDEDVSLLSEVDLVKHLNARESGVQVVMEMLHSIVLIIVGESVELSDFKHGGK